MNLEIKVEQKGKAIGTVGWLSEEIKNVEISPNTFDELCIWLNFKNDKTQCLAVFLKGTGEVGEWSTLSDNLDIRKVYTYTLSALDKLEEIAIETIKIFIENESKQKFEFKLI